MSNSNSPEEIIIASDVVTVEETSVPDFSSKNLPELVETMQQLGASDDRLERSKEAESIKSAFYKLLSKLKAEAQSAAEAAGAELESASAAANAKFSEVEESFKSLYADYKRERAEYNRKLEEERAANLKAKQAVIDELKALVEAQEDVNSTFPRFREIQAKWKEIGPVPAASFRDINQTYQFFVEQFYDMVRINHDLRDLDFKKNLEAKEAFCAAAEKLAENENVVAAFRELQKLHEQWKDFGPVAKEFRDSIWERFKAATAVINKRYQEHFETMKEAQQENLSAKEGLCAKIEELVSGTFSSSSEWNNATKEIEALQAEWRKIGFATRKENQKIYDRFRASCDKFFEAKRDFYNGFKDEMNANLEKKMAIIREVEELKVSTEWKKTTDRIIELQKNWKEIGAVPRKKSKQLWKQFRAACDEFFENKSKNASPENDYYGNLKAKKAIIEEVRNFSEQAGEALDKAAAAFEERWSKIGFVPFKEKEKINAAFREAMKEKFPDYRKGPQKFSRKAQSPKDTMISKYKALQQDIVTYENNIGFFASSKNSAPLIAQMQERIDKAKAELKNLENEIRKFESEEDAQ